MDKPLNLIFDAFALAMDGDNVIITVFSKNLGTIQIVLPLSALADYFGVLAHAFENTED